MTLRELNDFTCWTDAPPPPLVTLCARSCVMYSELLLGQLEGTVLSTTISRLLVETYQEMGCIWYGMRKRFFAALRGPSGPSPWVFPGDPVVIPDKPTGPPTTVCLEYIHSTLHEKLLLELVEHRDQISGLVCYLRSAPVPSGLNLSKYIDIDGFTNNFSPSDESIVRHLEIHWCDSGSIEMASHFSNLQWLCLTDFMDTTDLIHDLSPIFSLHRVRHLDLQTLGKIKNAKETLTKLLSEMPELEYLDISQTDLDEGDLQGLFELRHSKPLQFLGLFDTTHGGCFLPNLPAEVVSGTANVEQRVAALESLLSDLTAAVIINSISCWKTQLNYIIQLVKMCIKKRRFSDWYLVIKALQGILPDQSLNIPRRVKQELFDMLVDYLQFDRMYHNTHVREDFFPVLLDLAQQICAHYPTSIGRLLALYINYLWNPSTTDDYFVPKLEVNYYRQFVDVSKDVSIRIVDAVNCQLKNLVSYLDSLNTYTYSRNPERDNGAEVTASIIKLITGLYAEVDHPSLAEFKSLSGQIKQLYENLKIQGKSGEDYF